MCTDASAARRVQEFGSVCSPMSDEAELVRDFSVGEGFALNMEDYLVQKHI